MCVFAQVVVMNGCSSLFSCIAAVICDPKGRYKMNTHTHAHTEKFKAIFYEYQFVDSGPRKSGHVSFYRTQFVLQPHSKYDE